MGTVIRLTYIENLILDTYQLFMLAILPQNFSILAFLPFKLVVIIFTPKNQCEVEKGKCNKWVPWAYHVADFQ